MHLANTTDSTNSDELFCIHAFFIFSYTQTLIYLRKMNETNDSYCSRYIIIIVIVATSCELWFISLLLG